MHLCTSTSPEWDTNRVKRLRIYAELAGMNCCSGEGHGLYGCIARNIAAKQS